MYKLIAGFQLPLYQEVLCDLLHEIFKTVIPALFIELVPSCRNTIDFSPTRLFLLVVEFIVATQLDRDRYSSSY
jgi:hypothetical protein